MRKDDRRRLCLLCTAMLTAAGVAGCGSGHSSAERRLASAPAPTTTAATTSNPSPPNFLTPESPITEGTPERGKWQIVLDGSLVSTQPLSGTAPTKPTDRLLELRVTITYLTPGPPGDFALATQGFALVEEPRDLGLSHVPSAAEQDDAGPESKDVECGETSFAGLCRTAGPGIAPFELYADDNGVPGSTISQSELRYLNQGESESFWLVVHVPETIQPTHVALVFGDQLLSELPAAAQRVARGEAP